MASVLWLTGTCLAQEVTSEPLRAPAAPATGKFSSISPAESGIDFRNQLAPKHIKNYLLLGAGLTVGDYDGDGLPDLFLCNQDGPNQLYRQVAPWRFEDVTAAAGIRHLPGWSGGAAFADVDNDGDLDLFVCNKGNHNELYRNQGNGTFKGGYVQQPEPAKAAPTMAAFADYDRDGDLDLYLTRTRLFSVQEMFGYRIGLIQDEQGQWKAHPQYGDELELIDNIPRELGGRDQLFENTGITESGIPKFNDVTAESGISQALEHGLAAVWWDANNDNWPDLFVSNDFHTPDHLYLNQRDGSFKDVTSEAVPYTSWSSMGSDFSDINNDGLIDYLTTDMSATTHFKQKTMMGSMLDTAWLLDHLEPRQYMRNVMLINTGTPAFLESAQLGGIDSTDWTWAAQFGDLDNDGFEDVFFTNGIERNVNDSDLSIRMNELKKQGANFQEIQKAMVATPRHTEQNLAYQNQGDLTFEDVSQAWGLGAELVSHGAALADLDRDGDLDLVINNMNDPVSLYRNDLGTAGKSLLVQLRGKKSNHFGLGARLVARTAAATHTRMVTSSRGYMTGVEPVAHFGLGDTEKLESLEIHWPSGIVQTLDGLESGKLHTIHEPAARSSSAKPNAPAPAARFQDHRQASGIEFTHRENNYDDFADQPLLPHRLSRLGPALVVGDGNADGLDDVYLGGAAGQAGALYLQVGDARWELAPNQDAFASDATHEDTGGVFLDWDADGDLDLYVVSGGASEKAATPHYRDRLYLNDGRGSFSKGSLATTPSASGSCAAASDFDRDGDVDLFVGNRFIPQRYPHSGASTLLLNGESVTSRPLDLGLVTDALWADVNGDGWQDLVVATEWGPVRILLNENGQLRDTTDDCQLAPYTGWWNRVAAADLDADGDLDLLATNLGLNTKYHATPKSPVAIYAGDFGENGTLRIVEAANKKGQLLPVRGKSCSTHAMPHLAEKFPTFHAFAAANLTDIYSKEGLDKALSREAVHLASSVFLNDGKGRFQVAPLPPLAQLAPGFGIVLKDLDGDQHIDAFIAQNFYHSQRETGRMNAGLGVFLNGRGDGSFDAVWPKASGLTLRDDCRGAALLRTSADPVIIVAVNSGRPQVWKHTP